MNLTEETFLEDIHTTLGLPVREDSVIVTGNKSVKSRLGAKCQRFLRAAWVQERCSRKNTSLENSLGYSAGPDIIKTSRLWHHPTKPEQALTYSEVLGGDHPPHHIKYKVIVYSYLSSTEHEFTKFSRIFMT